MSLAEGVCAARTVGLVLQKVIAYATKVDAALDGVIAAYLGPGVDEVDVGLTSDPRHGCGVAHQWAGKNTQGNRGLSAGKWLSGYVYAGDADCGCIVGAVVVGLRVVPQVGNAKPRFGKEGRREDVIVVHARAVGRLIARAFKAASCRSAVKRAEGSLLEGNDTLIAVAAA